MPDVNPIVSVAGEGGGITLYQEIGGLGRFRVVMVDQSLTFLNEDEGGPAVRKDSGWLHTWDAAIAALSKWPWPMLVPRYVDPGFGEQVMAAVIGICKQKQWDIDSRNRRTIWRALCTGHVGRGDD
jgi:hypothetical protein